MGCSVCGSSKIEVYNNSSLKIEFKQDFTFMKNLNIGPYFLLEIENKYLNSEKKVELFERIVSLLQLIDYFIQFEEKYKKKSINYDINDIKIDNGNWFNEFIYSIDCSLLTTKKSNENMQNLYLKNREKFNSIMKKGVPQIFTQLIWNTILDMPEGLNEYEYWNLSKNKVDDDSKKVIDCDLPRTFPKIETFKNEKIYQRLERILLNISKFDSELEYVQGINFIVAFLLVNFGGDELSTFNFFIKIINVKSKKFGKEYKHVLTKGFDLLFKYNDELANLMKKENKLLWESFEKIGFIDFLWFSKWVQTLFTYCFDFYFIRKFFDLILINNVDFILEITLLILNQNQEKFNNLKTLEECIRIMESLYELNEENIRVINLLFH